MMNLVTDMYNIYNVMMRKKILILVLVLILLLGGFWVVNRKHSNIGTIFKKEKTSSSNGTVTQKPFDKSQYSLTDPASIWIVVNKQHQLNPKNYVPADLVTPSIPLDNPGGPDMQVRRETATALEQMFAAAKTEGINLMLASGYRSYVYQIAVYNGFVKTQGQATADKSSARPGYSEHQTGFAADIEGTNRKCRIDQCFANTPEGQWLVANAYKYGFIIRYQLGAESITGYEYEPWHVRYIGKTLANELHSKNIETLEQFFNVSGGTSY
jgi:D-alanyl-D-alanine carboxypeptidase